MDGCQVPLSSWAGELQCRRGVLGCRGEARGALLWPLRQVAVLLSYSAVQRRLCRHSLPLPAPPKPYMLSSAGLSELPEPSSPMPRQRAPGPASEAAVDPSIPAGRAGPHGSSLGGGGAAPPPPLSRRAARQLCLFDIQLAGFGLFCHGSTQLISLLAWNHLPPSERYQRLASIG